MKRFGVFPLLAAFFVTWLSGGLPVSFAEGTPTFQDVYWAEGGYSIGLYETNGGTYEVDRLSVERMAEGVLLRYKSESIYKEDLSVIVLYGNEVLPFYANHADETVLQYDWTLPAEEGTGEVLVQPELEKMKEKVIPGTCVQVLLVTWQNVWDIEDTRSLGNNVASSVVRIGEEVPWEDFPDMSERGGNLWMQSTNGVAVECPPAKAGEDENRNFVFEVNSTQPEISFLIKECKEDRVIIPMVNRRVVVQEDGRTLSARAIYAGDEVAEGSMVLPLEPGENEVCFLIQPADGNGLVTSSFKYLITAPAEAQP